MSKIGFKVKLFKVNTWTIIKLPQSASSKLSSRGIVMIAGTINGKHFQTALEPDGKGSHWFEVDKYMRKDIGVEDGDTVSLEVEQVSEWPEPEIPEDIKKTLSSDKKVYEVWNDITPMARWEWLRWIRATKSEETRKRRIEVARSKLKSGHRRPCCFNTKECTVQYVSNKGILLDPE